MEEKTKAERLIIELVELRKRVAALEKEKACWDQAHKAIKEIEANYRLLFSAESNAIVIIDVETIKIVDANDAAIALYGYSREEFLQLKAFELSAEKAETTEHINKVALGKLYAVSDGPVQRLHKKKDGTTFFVEITSGLCAREERKMIFAIFHDVTFGRQAEEALRESEAKFQMLAESAPAAIFILQGEHYVYVNPGWEAGTGYSKEESFSMSPWDVIHPSMRERVKKQSATRMKGRQVSLRSEIKIITKSGELRFFDHSYNIIKYQDKPAILGIAIDITDRKQAEAALAQERDRLQEALKKIKKLNGMLPICSSCKKIRDDKGYWNQIESYISHHSEAKFSHGICPECMNKLYPYYEPGGDKL